MSRRALHQAGDSETKKRTGPIERSIGPTCAVSAGLEQDAAADLNNSIAEGTKVYSVGDLAEVDGIESSGRSRQVGEVEHVCRFTSKLECEPLVEGEITENGSVDTATSGRVQSVLS